jgi:PAS domain S-box-containing protein
MASLTTSRRLGANVTNVASTMDAAEVSFRYLMDAAPVMIWVAGTDKLCTWFNKPWLDFTGRSMAQELGNGWADGVHPDDRARCFDIYNAHFDRRVPFRMEYRLRRADGEYRWILDAGVPRPDLYGVFQGYIGSCIDITALKQLEFGLEEKIMTRDIALNAASRIAASIAHEAQNFITALGSALWFIHKNPGDPSVVRKRVDDVEKAAHQASQVIQQLLATVRHRSNRELVHLNGVIADMRAILQGAAGEHVSIDMNLSAAPDSTTVNRAHLQAALLNLVTNARDAMPEGGTVAIETRNVSVRPESIDERELTPGRYVVVIVSDTGEGMSEEVRERALEPFFTTKDGDHGTGLGLPQVSAFAGQSGGTVRIESVVAKGTTVRIYLPLDGATLETHDSG